MDRPLIYNWLICNTRIRHRGRDASPGYPSRLPWFTVLCILYSSVLYSCRSVLSLIWDATAKPSLAAEASWFWVWTWIQAVCLCMNGSLVKSCANYAVAELFVSELDFSLLTSVCALRLRTRGSHTTGKELLWMKRLGQKGKSLPSGSEL